MFGTNSDSFHSSGSGSGSASGSGSGLSNSSLLVNSPTFSSSFVLIEGSLKKRRTNSALGNLGLSLLKYQQFYFVLEQGFLSYFKDQKSRQSADPPLFRVPVHEIHQVAVPTTKTANQSNVFLIYFRSTKEHPSSPNSSAASASAAVASASSSASGDSQRVLELLADSRSEFDRWRSMLDLVLNQTRDKIDQNGDDEENASGGGKETKSHNKRELHESDLIPSEPEVIREFEQFSLSVSLELVGPASDRVSPLVVLYSPVINEKQNNANNRQSIHPVAGIIPNPANDPSDSAQLNNSTNPSFPSSSSFAAPPLPSISTASELEILLNHSSLASQLLEFCRSQHFEEYLLFYWDVQKYKKFYANQFPHSINEPAAVNSTANSANDFALKSAQAIYEKFIKSGSEYELESNSTQKNSVFQSIQTNLIALNLFESFEKKVLSDLRTEFLPKYIEKHGSINNQLASLADSKDSGGSNSVQPSYTKKVTGNYSSGLGIATAARGQKDSVIKGWEEICRTEIWPAVNSNKTGAAGNAISTPNPQSYLVSQHSMASSRHLLGDGESPLLAAESENSVRAFRCLLNLPCDPALVAHTERRVNFMNKIRTAEEKESEKQPKKGTLAQQPPGLNRAATMATQNSYSSIPQSSSTSDIRVVDAEFHGYQRASTGKYSNFAPIPPPKPASQRTSLTDSDSIIHVTSIQTGGSTSTRPSGIFQTINRKLSSDDLAIPTRRSIIETQAAPNDHIFINSRPPASGAANSVGFSSLAGAISFPSLPSNSHLRSRTGFIDDIIEGAETKVLRFHIYNVIDPSEEDVSKQQLLGGVQTTLKELLKSENGELIKNVTFIDTGVAASLRGALSIMFQDRRRVKISSTPRFIYRSYIFRDVNNRDFLAHEQLEESPFTFTLPHAAMRRAIIDCKSMRKTVLDQMSEAQAVKGKTPEDVKVRADLTNFLTYQAVEYNAAITKLEKLTKVFANYNGEYKGFRFKPSKEKSNGPLSYVPINCNLQSFTVVRHGRHRTLKALIKSESFRMPIGGNVALVKNHAMLAATQSGGHLKKAFPVDIASTAPQLAIPQLSHLTHSNQSPGGLATAAANEIQMRNEAAIAASEEQQFKDNSVGSRIRSVVSVRPLSIKEIEAKLIFRPKPVQPTPTPTPVNPAIPAPPQSEEELQRLRLLDALANTGLISGMNPNAPLTDDEDPKFKRIRPPNLLTDPTAYSVQTLQCVTVGAFVHHSFGLKQGGLLRQLQSLQESQTKLDREFEERLRGSNAVKNENFLIEPLKRVMEKMWNVQQRQQVVVSQALTAYTTSLISELLASIDDHERWNRIAEIGFLCEMESLLSTFSNELYMLSDHFYAIRTLENVQFTFARQENESEIPEPPQPENQLPSSLMDKIKLRLRVGGATHLPTLALSLKHRFLKPRKLPRWARLSFSNDDEPLQISLYRRLREIFALGLNAEFQQFDAPPFTPKIKVNKAANSNETKESQAAESASESKENSQSKLNAADYFELFNVNAHIAATFVVEIQLPAPLYARLAPALRINSNNPNNNSSSASLPAAPGGAPSTPSSSIMRALTETEEIAVTPDNASLTSQLEANRIPMMKLTSEAASSNLPRLSEYHADSPAGLTATHNSSVDPLVSGLGQASIRNRLLAEEEKRKELEEENKRIEENQRLEAQRLLMIEAERRRRKLEGFEDEEEITTPLFSCAPLLFTQGINELQSVANKMGKTELQSEINTYGVKHLKRYFMGFCRYYLNNGIQTQSHLIAELIEDLQKLEGLIHAFHGEKNVALLLTANAIVRKLNGGRLICCKSAKDRTSMSVTYQQLRWLYEEHGLNDSDCALALGLFRIEGVRRFNVLKNTGGLAYAFNKLQRSLLPVPFRPPEQACSSSVDS